MLEVATRKLSGALLVGFLGVLVTATTASAGAKASSNFWKGNKTYAETRALNGFPCRQKLTTPYLIPSGAICQTSGMGGSGWASAWAMRGFHGASTHTSGNGWAGRGMSAPKSFLSPATRDTFDLTRTNTGLHQITLQLHGEAVLDPGTAPGLGGDDELFVGVYRDSASAWEDSLNTGTGTVWYGRLVMDTTPGGTGVSTAAGGFATSDFIVTHGPGGSMTVATRPGLVYVVPGVPDTAAAHAVLAVESSSMENVTVPAHSAAWLCVLAVLLAGTGIFALGVRLRSGPA